MSTAHSDVRLVVLDGPQALARAEALAACYRAAFTAPGYDETDDDVTRFATEQLPTHAAREGCRLVAALGDDDVVRGFGYGYTGERGQWWSDHVVGAVPSEVADAWVGGHFELVEMATEPAYQGRGIGAQVHDALLAGLPHDRALLGTYPDERPAVRLYRSRGWRRLASLSETSDLWGLRLGWPTAPPLVTARLALEPLRVVHADEVAAALDDRSLHRFIGGEPETAAALRARYRRIVTGRSTDGSQGWLNWVLRRSDTGVVIGTVQATLHHVNGRRIADLAWVVATPHQGQGYATEAATAVAEWLQAHGTAELRAYVHPDHEASNGIARRLGLRPTSEVVDGEVCWRSA